MRLSRSAEVEKFLDTPVKALLERNESAAGIRCCRPSRTGNLIVDEVLAVGDVAFQEKCLGKMGKVAKDGRTVLFVSHNLPTVQHLCNRAILLQQGEIAACG